MQTRSTRSPHPGETFKIVHVTVLVAGPPRGPSAGGGQDCGVSSQPFGVRAAEVRDVSALLALVHSAYRGESSRAGWTTEADLLDGPRLNADLLLAELTDPATTVLLTEDEHGPVGCATVTDRGDGLFYFGLFAVRPGAQGGGIGSALLDAAEAHGRARGGAVMEMTVISVRADLIAWYARRGYRATGQRRPFPYGDERYGLPRRDDLEFSVLRKELGASVQQ
jgi:GNAT superfamily N-acetyltransferase